MSALDPLGIGTAEKLFDAFLFGANKGVATTLGWGSYHTLRSKGSKAGWPDRSCWRERLIFVELKTMDKASKPSEYQIEVMTSMAKAGAEVYLWRQSDYDEAIQVLGVRSVFSPLVHDDAMIGVLRSPTLGTWTPKSLWTPHGFRVDALQ